MSLTLEIVTPEKKAFSGKADAITVPTADGEIQILPGHISLLTMMVPGEIVVKNGDTLDRLAVDKGFARVLGETVSIVTQAAIDEKRIDLSAAKDAQQRAEKALAAARANAGEIDPAELEKLEQIIRFAVVQRLVKAKNSSISE